MKKRCLRCNEIYCGKYENCRTCREEMKKIAEMKANGFKWDEGAKRWVRRIKEIDSPPVERYNVAWGDYGEVLYDKCSCGKKKKIEYPRCYICFRDG